MFIFIIDHHSIHNGKLEVVEYTRVHNNFFKKAKIKHISESTK